MKHINTIKITAFVFIACLLFNACSTNNEFSKQKYTNFKHSKHHINLAGNSKYQPKAPVKKEADLHIAPASVTPAEVTEKSATALASPELNQVAEVSKTNTKANKKTTTIGTDKKTVAHVGKFATLRAFKATASALKKSGSSTAAGDVDLIILVILAIIIPPLAVYLKEGATSRFVLDLILALIGVLGGVFFWYAGLFYLAAIIYALIIVLG